MNWTQPICGDCYNDIYPRREPVRVTNMDSETCCVCGEPTREGIYYRVDPRTVRFPTHIQEQSS